MDLVSRTPAFTPLAVAWIRLEGVHLRGMFPHSGRVGLIQMTGSCGVMRPWEYRPRGHPERGDMERLQGLSGREEFLTLWTLAVEQWEELSPAERDELWVMHKLELWEDEL